MQDKLTLSTLPHTWILDADGTICVHNGHKHGGDRILPGVKEFFAKIPAGDMIVIITSRKESEKAALEAFLKKNGLRYDHIICDAPMGERILINDKKPSGLITAYSINLNRNEGIKTDIAIDKAM